jgi:Rhamnan synthesis protein F
MDVSRRSDLGEIHIGRLNHENDRLLKEYGDTDVWPIKIPHPSAAAAASFSSLNEYILWLGWLGRKAIDSMRQWARDFVTLRDDPLFDPQVFLPPGPSTPTREDAIIAFVISWAAAANRRLPGTNFFLRRPCAGFHPHIYAHENAERYDTAMINPLAHLIRSGLPKGPWRYEVITPGSSVRLRARRELRAAIHGHFFYPELAEDFFRRLAGNRARCDVWLTTDQEWKATMLRETALACGAGNAVIRLLPNRGRDLGAFLTGVMPEMENRYDVIGHIHGKRSPQTLVGDQWREFIWQNLLGRLFPMIDTILARFAADEALGMVFPDDPHLPDWDANLDVATLLARRMGIDVPLPPFFNFPVGSMFWVRPRALAPLLKLNIGWDDYPEEPLANDGTILHALERLLPFVAKRAGYRHAATHVPTVSWDGAVGTIADLECVRTMPG